VSEIEHGRCGELLSVCSGDDVMGERDIARDAAEHWQGVAIAADEQLAGVVEERDRRNRGGR
jgi:hypothetical protein